MNALLIAHNTFREVIRDRVLLGLVAAGVAVLAASQPLAVLALGEGVRLTADLGLSAISLLGLLAILLVGSHLVAKEVERRTVFNLLSRPIARPTYLLGKWIGLAAALAVFAVVLGAALAGLLVWLGAPLQARALLPAVYLAGLELGVLAAVAVMFSALSTPVLSALYTLGLFVVGASSQDLREFAPRFPGAMQATVETVANVVPNLPLFNVRALVAQGQMADAGQLVVATGYAVFYVACVLALASAAFETREFK